MQTIHRFHNPSRDLLRDCTTSPINRLQHSSEMISISIVYWTSFIFILLHLATDADFNPTSSILLKFRSTVQYSTVHTMNDFTF